MASIAARLAAWIAEHPDAAVELRAMMEDADREVTAQRRAAGQASAAARAVTDAPFRERALQLAVAAREATPAASQGRVAARCAAALGREAPADRTLRRWIAAWEASGRLPSPRRNYDSNGRWRTTSPREPCKNTPRPEQRASTEMSMSDYKIGDRVSFMAGPRSTSETTAKVTAHAEGGFLTTTDVEGKVRKVRPGSCRKAA